MERVERKFENWILPFGISFLLAWLWAFRDVYFYDEVLLPADSFKTHLNLFSYIFNYLRQMGSFPDWVYSQEGGLWIAPLTNNYLTLVPYRFFGYALSLFAAVPSNIAYKLSFLLVGIPLFLWSLYRFLSRLFESKSIARLGLAMAFLSSIHLSLFHQEQALATMFFWPWIGICLLNARTESRYYLGAAFLLGLNLNFHYPHLWVLYLVSLGLLAFVLYRKTALNRLADAKLSRKFVILGVVGFLISVSPVIYSYFGYRDKLASDFREQKSGIESGTYKDYHQLNLQQMSSVHPANFSMYLNLKPGRPDLVAPLDMKSFFLSPLLIIFLITGIFLPIPFKALQYGAIGVLALLAMGIYGPFAKPLFYVVPGMSLFRQWFHFIPFLNLHLLILFLSVAQLLLRSRIRTAGLALMTVSLGFGFFWSIHNFFDVRRYTMLSKGPHIQDQAGAFPRLAVQENRALQYPLHANVKELDLGQVKRNTAQGGLYWTDAQGSLLRPAMDGVEVKERGGDLEVEWLSKPPGAMGMSLLQFNDGNWNVLQDGRKVSIPSAEWVSVATRTAKGSFILSRARTAWGFLALAMWLPLMVFLGWMGYERFRFGFKK